MVVFQMTDAGQDFTQDATEDIEMFTRHRFLSSAGRAIAIATVAAIALTAFEQPKASAAQAAPKVVAAKTGTSDATDFSAARRRHYRGNGGAAAAAAFAGIVGTGLAIAAAQSRRDDYYYGGGPAYYGGGPAYYGDSYGYYGGGGYGYRNSGVPRFNGHPLAGW